MTTREAVYRTAKARKLADALTAAGATAEDLELLDEAGWAAAEKVAGVGLSSSTTRAVVAELMAPTVDDPFAGFGATDVALTRSATAARISS